MQSRNTRQTAISNRNINRKQIHFSVLIIIMAWSCLWCVNAACWQQIKRNSIYFWLRLGLAFSTLLLVAHTHTTITKWIMCRTMCIEMWRIQILSFHLFFAFDGMTNDEWCDFTSERMTPNTKTLHIRSDMCEVPFNVNSFPEFATLLGVHDGNDIEGSEEALHNLILVFRSRQINLNSSSRTTKDGMASGMWHVACVCIDNGSGHGTVRSIHSLSRL